MMNFYDDLQFRWEAFALLPYIYTLKLWQAHREFMEDLFDVIGS